MAGFIQVTDKIHPNCFALLFCQLTNQLINWFLHSVATLKGFKINKRGCSNHTPGEQRHIIEDLFSILQR